MERDGFERNGQMEFDESLLAYCGLYCEQCSIRTAYRERDTRHLDNIPAKYKTEYPDLSTFDCEGCKRANLCGPCTIKDCAAPKGIRSCAECAEFLCDTLSAFGHDGLPHHEQALKNLNTIRQVGIDAWFAELTPSLRCACGQRQSWYFTCPEHVSPNSQ
jgi:hypothetical protein